MNINRYGMYLKNGRDLIHLTQQQTKEQAIKDLVEKKGLDKKMVEDLIDIFGAQKIKELPKVTDEGILELETILKNLSTEGRKLNASGGLAKMLGE